MPCILRALCWASLIIAGTFIVRAFGASPSDAFSVTMSMTAAAMVALYRRGTCAGSC